MHITTVVALTFAIGVVAGLRSMTAPAVTSLAAHWRWFSLQHSGLAFMGSAVAAYLFAAAAIVELVVDKLPKAPSRKEIPGLIARIVFGGLSGATLCAAANKSVALGAALGGLGGIAGAFAGYEVRMRLVKALNVPDFVIALLEDAVAIGGGFLIVSRF
ncbi:MAG TPA: DUF4126 family protein [Blastocatellia bacterium]|jgi:uncharacterized membrane protein|nr:DUF4126 family protein [Blastocatellia bacterium]